MKSRLSITVVIPNYNGAGLLPQILPCCFEALHQSGSDYEVIICDDCSTDDSIKFIQKNYPDIILLKNAVNLGFSPTINKGIFAAKNDLVLLMNSDVKLQEDYFINQFRYFDREDSFGVMGRIIGWNDEKIQDAAKYPGFHGAKIKTSKNYYAKEPAPDDWLYSFYLSGANALVDRKKILQLGGFNEIYAPFYVEDVELSLRAWRLGWKCYYDHFSVCHHKVSESIKTSSRKNYINTIYYRNKMYLHATHLNGSDLFFWYLQQIPEALIRIFTGRFYYLKSLQLFIRNFNKVRCARQDLKKLGKELLPVKKVVDEIKASVANRSIEIF